MTMWKSIINMRVQIDARLPVLFTGYHPTVFLTDGFYY